MRDRIQVEVCASCNGSGKACTKCLTGVAINTTIIKIIAELKSKPRFKDDGYLKLIKSLENNLTEQKPTPKTVLPEITQVEEWLEGQRGNVSPQFAAERKSIKWMLQHGYDPNDICLCYSDLKKEKFWESKFLSMVSVKTQIGEWIRKGGKPIMDDPRSCRTAEDVGRLIALRKGLRAQ